MRGEILVGVERRRWWSEDQKFSILADVGVNGATVTQVAQRHEITRQQIYAWRHKMRRKTDLGKMGPMTFLPIDTWHDVIGEPTFADAILDRLIHNAYRADLDGQSIRKTKIKVGDENSQN